MEEVNINIVFPPKKKAYYEKLLASCVQATLVELQHGNTPELPPQTSLRDLIEMQKWVEKYNQRQTKNKSSKKKQYLNIADRQLAAIYACFRFAGGTFSKPNVLCKVNGKILLCIDEKAIIERSADKQ